MKQYSIRFDGKTVQLRLHSKLDSVISMVLDALIEKTLTVYKDIKYHKDGLLSCYNKGKYIFAATKDDNGNLHLDFCTDKDFKEGKIEYYFSEFIQKNSDLKPFLETCSSYPITEREYPWDKD